MIDDLLTVIKDDLDTYLKLKLSESQENYVQLVPVVDMEGKPSVVENAICMSLIKIDEERNNMSDGAPPKRFGDQVHHYPPAVKLYLYILFSTSYLDGKENNYSEALKRLSFVIHFFQGKPVFNAQNTPMLDPSYGNIKSELFHLGMEEQSHLWGILGSLYRPSVLYRFRALMVRQDQITRTSQPTEKYDNQLEPVL